MGQALRFIGPALFLICILFRTAVTTAKKGGKDNFSVPPTPPLLDFEAITAAAGSTTEGTDTTCGPNVHIISNGPKFHSMWNGVNGPRFHNMTKGPETLSEMPGLWLLLGVLSAHCSIILTDAFFPMQPHLPSKEKAKQHDTLWPHLPMMEEIF